jgi:hypothetical protein
MSRAWLFSICLLLNVHAFDENHFFNERGFNRRGFNEDGIYLKAEAEPINEPFKVVLSPEYEMSWSFNTDKTIMTVNLLFKTLDRCWAGIGLREDSNLAMAGSFYWLAEQVVGTDGITTSVIITEAVTNPENPYFRPSALASQSSILSSTFTSSADGFMYTFQRVMAPDNGAFRIAEGMTYYLQWAHCSANDIVTVSNHQTNRFQGSVLPSIDFFSGEETEESTGPAIFWGVSVVQAAGFGSLLMLTFIKPNKFRDIRKPGLSLVTLRTGIILHWVALEASFYASTLLTGLAHAERITSVRLFLLHARVFSGHLCHDLCRANSSPYLRTGSPTTSVSWRFWACPWGFNSSTPTTGTSAFSIAACCLSSTSRWANTCCFLAGACTC